VQTHEESLRMKDPRLADQPATGFLYKLNEIKCGGFFKMGASWHASRICIFFQYI